MQYTKIDIDPAEKKYPGNTSMNQVIKNSFFNVGAWGLNIVVLFLATPFLVSKLTVEGYGIFALLTGLVGFYSLLDLGLGQGVTKFVAEYKAKDDIDGISQSINSAIWIQTSIGLIGSLLILIFADLILTLLRVTPQFLADAKISLYVSAIGLIFLLVAGTLSSALMGLQRYDITSTVGGLTSAVLNISIVAVLYFGYGLRHAMYLTLLSGFVLFIIYFYFLHKILDKWRITILPSKSNAWILLRFSSYMFLSRTSSLFSNYVVRFVVGFFLGPISVTYYVVSARLVNTIGSLLYNAFITIFPFSSEVGAQKDLAKVQQLYVDASKLFASFAFPLLLFTTVFSKPIITLWMGPEFAEKSWIVLSLLAFGGLIGSLSTVPNLMTMGLGYSRIIGIYSIINLLAYTIFLPPLTKWGGVNGTAFAMLLANIPVFLLIAYQTRKIFHMGLMEYLMKTMSFHIIPVIISLGLMSQATKISSSLREILYPLTFLITYFVLMVIFDWLPIRGFISRFRHSFMDKYPL